MTSSARPHLSVKATAYVRGLVMSGELRPGTLVRPETIGEDLGISTTPAREALQALRVESFLELIPRHGFVVARLTGQDIRDLFQVQALIAGALAARAAANATDQDVAELQALHHELIAPSARNDHDRLEEKNQAFHREINLIAASQKTVWVLGLITRYFPRQFYSSIPGWPNATMDEHAELLEGIKAKDPEAIRSAIQQHIVHSGEHLAAHFDDRVAAATVSATNAA
jgi:DNA-binding GntR family transcriptional regulator